MIIYTSISERICTKDGMLDTHCLDGAQQFVRNIMENRLEFIYYCFLVLLPTIILVRSVVYLWFILIISSLFIYSTMVTCQVLINVCNRRNYHL